MDKGRKSHKQMKTLKVVHFIHALNMGGAETLVKNYALFMDKSKFDVTVLCLSHEDSPYEKLLTDAGIKQIYICDFLRFDGRKGYGFRILNFVLRYCLVKRKLKKIDPDIIHIHLSLNSYIRFAKPLSHTKIFYTQHNSVSYWKKKYPNDVKALRWLLKHYQTQLIAVNSKAVDELNQLFDIGNTVLINNGIDQSLYKTPLNRELKRLEIGIPEQSFLIVHVGRFNPVKNHEFLIKVFLEIRKEKNNAFLLMVGKGETEKKIRDVVRKFEIEDCVRILNDRTDIPDILRISDAALFPSLKEGLGIAVIEMQMAGLPCVVSTGVPNDACISNKLEHLDLKESPKVWADRILALAKDESQIQYDDLEAWDFCNNVRKLECLYEGE